MGNSVIYRPAYDAEVEYLESTGTQYIDTGIKPDNTYTFDCKVAKIQSNYNCVFWGTRNSGESNTFNEQCYLNANDWIPVTKFAEIILFSTSTDIPESNWNSGITPIVNTMYELTGMTVVSTMNQMTYPITLFGFNMIGVINPSLGICRIGYWKCYSNGVLVRDMIPVRIGQVGYLYDKVTKQLFANKGTGNFILGNDVVNAVIPQQRCVLYFGNQRSVGFERIYEEYEWLKGDGSAYLYLGEVSNYIEFDADIPQADIQFRFVYGNNGALRVYMANQVFSALVDANKIKNYNTPLQSKIKIDLNTHLAYSNGEAFAHTNLGAGANGESAFKSAFFFGNYSQTTSVFRGKCAIGNVDMDGNVFIPCKLLQPIPAILDGNGIARQAGECGMWDKVSNRFYGNVAGSGTFTVKGPKCYEEYKWLNSVSGGEYISLALGSNTDSNAYIRTTYKCNYNSRYFDISIGGSKNVSNNQSIRIFNISNTTFIDVHKWTNGTQTSYRKTVGGGSSGVERSLYVTLTNWQVDNQSGTVTLGTAFDTDYDYQATELRFPNSSYAYKRTQMRTNNKEFDLVPCKLIHGIPASMDANGIARPAGTCGMWDKVNDKFYGNVASSGTFTVSND